MTQTIQGDDLCSDNASKDCIKIVDNETLANILSQSREWASQYGIELYPFRISKYNEKVAQEYQLDYHDNTVAFVALSSPTMFEKAFVPFLNEEIESVKSNTLVDPLDQCMRKCFSHLKRKIEIEFEDSVELIHDFELQMPSRRPKVLLQTAAHVSGAAFYYKRFDRFKLHCLGVCIHPKYGGWFGIRALLVLSNVQTPNLVECPPIDVLPDDQARARLLCLFNEEWQSGQYRDIIPVQERYSQLQIDYFKHKPKDRMQFIKQNILTQWL